VARATLDSALWAALRFQVAFRDQLREQDLDVRAIQVPGNWFAWRIIRTLRSSPRLLSVEEISDHLKCTESEVATTLTALRGLRLIVVATTPGGRQVYALSPAALSLHQETEGFHCESAPERSRKRKRRG
jgi:hypothetical protein